LAVRQRVVDPSPLAQREYIIATYQDGQERGYTTEDIIAAAPKRGHEDEERAKGVLTLLHYNTIANNGAEPGAGPTLSAALAHLYALGFRVMLDAEEEQGRAEAMLRERTEEQ